MSDVELVDADHLDYDAFSVLQKNAYAGLLEKMEVSGEHMTPDFYRWKFHTPAGPGKIAQVSKEGRILSANAMMPTCLRLGTKRFLGWQFCDGGTLPEARRKGYYEKCIDALMGTLRSDEVFFGFPNPDIVRRIDNMGWKSKGIATTWVKPVIFSGKGTCENINNISKFDKGLDDLAEHLIKEDRVMLWRGQDYLNWRYTRHPAHDYSLFVYREKGRILGFSVVRITNPKGRKMAVVMELWGMDRPVVKALVKNMARHAARKNVRWMVMQDNYLSLMSGAVMGFIPVPACILPKKQVLVVRGRRAKFPERVTKSHWHVQFGDWDGF